MEKKAVNFGRMAIAICFDSDMVQRFLFFYHWFFPKILQMGMASRFFVVYVNQQGEELREKFRKMLKRKHLTDGFFRVLIVPEEFMGWMSKYGIFHIMSGAVLYFETPVRSLWGHIRFSSARIEEHFLST